MANFFEEIRETCEECGSELFKEEETFFLNKENNKTIKENYKTVTRCVACNHVKEIQ